MPSYEVLGVEGLPEVRPGDDVAALVAGAVALRDGDVVVVTSKLLSKADHELQIAVQDELAWSPELVGMSVVHIGVDKGTVTLYGQVETNVARLAAQHAASQVRGVRSIVNDIEVATETPDRETDEAETGVAAA